MGLKHAIVPFQVTHKRLTPKEYEFTHKFFWFKINLTDIKGWPTKLVGLNRPSLYSFYDKDHLDLGHRSAKENYIQIAKNNGIHTEIKEVYLYTFLRFFGYVFNPMSLVFLIDSEGKKHAIIEIGNTFNEIKPYFVSHSKFKDDGFIFKTRKHFYISPFIKHDNWLTFSLTQRGEELSLNIVDQDEDQTVLKVWFKGKEKEAKTSEIIFQTLLIPFVTLKTITLIHWHAFVLWAKGIKYFKKKDHSELQQGQFVWKK